MPIPMTVGDLKAFLAREQVPDDYKLGLGYRDDPGINCFVEEESEIKVNHDEQCLVLPGTDEAFPDSRWDGD